MEIRLFRYFVTLCEERHFGRAAERLGISPPTLTHQIQKLEKHFGTQLVRRKAKSLIVLTPTGERFLESARTVLDKADEAELVVRKTARGEVGRIEIGYMVIASLSGLVEKFVGSFRLANPSIDITLHQMSTVTQVPDILTNKLDCGFCRTPQQYPSGLSGFPIFRQPLVLAVPGTHPLAAAEHAISLRTLKDETFIGQSVEFEIAFQRHVESVASLAGFMPNIVKRAPNFMTALTYVSAGFGIAVVPRDLNRAAVPNVVYKSLAWKPAAEGVISFLHRANEASPVVKSFIDAMRAHALDNLDVERIKSRRA